MSPRAAHPSSAVTARWYLFFRAMIPFFAPVAFRVRTYGLDVGAGQAWVDHIVSNPAMLEWERQALAESWREESHEAELAAAGVVTADHRK